MSRYKHTHFLFRLNELTGFLALKALEQKFTTATVAERAQIARVTRRLRRKLKMILHIQKAHVPAANPV